MANDFVQLDERDGPTQPSGAGAKSWKRAGIAAAVLAALTLVVVIVIFATNKKTSPTPAPAPFTAAVEAMGTVDETLPAQGKDLERFNLEFTVALKLHPGDVQTTVLSNHIVTVSIAERPPQTAQVIQNALAGIRLDTFHFHLINSSIIDHPTTHPPTAGPAPTPTPPPTAPQPPTPEPTTGPTSSPTPAPTDSPTSSPSLSPTEAPTASPTTIPKPPYNPADFKMNFIGLGDWGVTTDVYHESVTRRKMDDMVKYNRAFNAQTNIAKCMINWAKQYNPSFVLSHGDNFYWTGITDTADERWQTVFENVYNDSTLYVPWYNVLGNHDYGGGSGFCGQSCWNCGQLCGSVAEMEGALNKKFDGQKAYKSPHNDRWVLRDHYYKASHSFPPGSANPEFTVDIFNIDTNAAAGRLPEICCQCFSTPASPTCDNPGPGNVNCINWPNTAIDPPGQFSKCVSMLKGWWADSMAKLKSDLAQSTATYKIVHNHYLMKHFSPDQIAEVKQILIDGGAHIFLGAHEHAEGHDFADGIHYLQNGGGGGAIASGGTGNVWLINGYGWIAARVSKYYLQVMFYDDNCVQLHCYNIPFNKADQTLGYSGFYCKAM